MTNSLTIPQLAERCRTEVERYRQTQQSNEIYCFELFQRALTRQEEAAWTAIYVQFQPLVNIWVHQYSRFSQTDEEASYFVNEAFIRMWQRYASDPEGASNLDRLGKCLQYLRMCIGSAIEDFLRRRKKDALVTAVTLEGYDRPNSGVAAEVEWNLILDKLRDILVEIIRNDQERLVVEESWVYDLAPRQIQKNHPEVFSDAAQVNQIKRNIIKRLKRHPNLRKMSKEWTKNS